MKIGIMGGTFDPIHNGHLMLGEYAYKQFELDEIWFMPNGNPPHKASESIESQTKNRVEMVKRAIKGVEYFYLQRYEVDNTEVNYSYKTVAHFNEIYPDYEFYFIIGADSLFNMEKWIHPEILLKSCKMLAAYRDEKSTDEMLAQIRYLNEKYGADIYLLNTPNVNISSSDIRKMIKEGISIQGLVPESVLQFIEEKQLFREE